MIAKEKTINIIKSCLLIILGTAILAFGTAIFIVPFNLITGGLSGVGLILDNLIKIDLSMPQIGMATNIDVYVFLLTWMLFFVGLISMGKDFAIKTLLSTMFYPVFFTVFHAWVNPNFLGGLFVLDSSAYKEIAVLLASVLGGVFVGAGCAITFVAGGSTGGVDILAFALCKIQKKLKHSHVIFLIDATVVAIGVFVISDLVLSMMGIISAFICAFVVDKVFLGSTTAYVAHIVTELDKSEAVCNRIINDLDRTATIVDATGAYSKSSKKMIIVSFNIREYPELIRIVNNIDPDAFLIISKAHEINGEGWKENN
jgi:uncharacterized membrane-anchored protein YitT (DUF2179 family)